MRRLVVLLILLILSVVIGVMISQDPGYAIFGYQHWTVEMPLWFFILAEIVVLLLFYWIFRLFSAIDSSWVGWKSWLRLRRKHKSYSKTNRGLIELIEANWKNAENDLMSGVEQSDAPLINFLASAKAAHEQNAYDRRDLYLRNAYDLSPQTHVAVGLMQAQLQLSQGKLEQAFATLTQLHHKNPKQTLVLKLLERVCIHLGDWHTLLKIIPELRKYKLVTEDQMHSLESRCYQELLSAAGKNSSLEGLRDFWSTVPKKIKNNSDVVYCYVNQLLRYPDTVSEVEDFIIKALKNGWHEGLVKLYGTLNSVDFANQLKKAENWDKIFPPHAILYLTLARLHFKNQLWGKAKYYYQESLKLESLPITHLEYGNLLCQLDETNAALKTYREGLK